MSGFREVKAELVANLREFYAGSDPTIQIEGLYVLNPTPPTIDVYAGRTPARDQETATIGDLLGAYILTVRVRVATADFDAGAELLDELIDDESDFSLGTAIHEDTKLGGHATDVDIRAFSGLTVYPDAAGAQKWIGFELEVLVLAAQS